MSPKKYPKRQSKDLARERIGILWDRALQIADSRPDLAKRWIRIAQKIAPKAHIRLPLAMSRRICKTCGYLLIPGKTCRIRVRHNRSTHLTVTCLECGSIRRFPITRQA